MNWLTVFGIEERVGCCEIAAPPSRGSGSSEGVLWMVGDFRLDGTRGSAQWIGGTATGEDMSVELSLVLPSASETKVDVD